MLNNQLKVIENYQHGVQCPLSLSLKALWRGCADALFDAVTAVQ